jgi:CrcB protein
MIKSIFFVGMGGAIGSVMRYLLGVVSTHYFKGTFPLATFITNFLGCLIIGLLIGYFGKNEGLNPQLKLLLITGFCGGFTTFSTFAAENVQLLENGNYGWLLGNVLGSVLIGMGGVIVGMKIL